MSCRTRWLLTPNCVAASRTVSTSSSKTHLVDATLTATCLNDDRSTSISYKQDFLDERSPDSCQSPQRRAADSRPHGSAQHPLQRVAPWESTT